MSIKVELRIKLNSSDDAFQDCPTFETARILRELAEKIEQSVNYAQGNVRDLNGNTVGSYYYQHDRDEEEV